MRTPHPEVRRLKAVKVNDFDIHDALRIVDDSGVADLLQEEMPRKKKGRKHAHSWRSILAFCLLTAINQRTGMHLAYGQRVWTGLSTQERDLLGFTVDPANSTLDRYLNNLVSATTPTLDMETGEVTDPRVSVSLEDLLNRLLLATTRGIESRDTLAIDAMPLEAWARRRGWKRDIAPEESSGPATDYGSTSPNNRPKKKVVSEPGWPRALGNGDYQPSLDPDARDVFIGSKNLSSSRIGNGFALHVACDVSPLGESDYPQIPRGIILVPGNESSEEAGIALIESLKRQGYDLRRVIVDRGYTQMSNWGRWLSERHVEQSLKLKANQMGPNRNPVPGTVMIDGRLFVDWMPKRLHRLPAFALELTQAESAALAERYDERAPYAFEPKGKPQWERGVQQYRGPATTRKVRCANSPASLRLPEDRPACPTVAQHEAGQPLSPCACGAQPSLGPDDALNLRQRFLYGTTKWLADHSRRSSVEGHNANAAVQVSSLQNRHAVRTTRSVGKRALLTTFAVIAYTVQMMRSRYGKTPSTFEPDEVVSTPLPKPVVRDKDGNTKRTLNVMTFARRKPRRQQGSSRPPRLPGPLTKPAWASRPEATLSHRRE
ncbi:transposase [Yimella sp. cx-51]|uniref:transposase n=1 Tax=Yimella sp. cx-51 TaxID=2770551 RepID=UPI00165DA77A|nr:transposase [Yimella sp. cx-51]MBC9957691.1 transposase [Yimella sp. cx-51]QTH36956.1 transposase [Yimella sp. cx-51]